MFKFHLGGNDSVEISVMSVHKPGLEWVRGSLSKGGGGGADGPTPTESWLSR